MKRKLTLHVQVIEACHLRASERNPKSSNTVFLSHEELETAKDEIICDFEIEKQTKKTQPAPLSKNGSCFWNEGFDLLLSSETQYAESKISILWNKRSFFGSKELIAETKMKVSIPKLMEQFDSLLTLQQTVLASKKTLPIEQTMDDFGKDWYSMEATSNNENGALIQPEIRVKFHLVPDEGQVEAFLDSLEPVIHGICDRPIRDPRRKLVPSLEEDNKKSQDNNNASDNNQVINTCAYYDEQESVEALLPSNGYEEGTSEIKNKNGSDSNSMTIHTVAANPDYEYGTRTFNTTKDDSSETQNTQTDFNARFQQIVEWIHSFTHETSMADKIEANADLMHLYQDFLHCAETYAKIIISEVYLPIEKKTIKPVDVGGIAGGEKYKVHSILFKFAIDKHGLFGSEESAIKVAGHELSGLISYYNTSIPGLSVPLCCLVDYKGFRVVAESVLPITKDTIIMGSHDGGNTFHSQGDSQLCEKLNRACQILNIVPHPCRNSLGKLAYGPIDLETHRGTDGRTYVVDFSRVQPPQARTSVKSGYLFQLLRPEFVQQYSKPLNSDAMSPFLLEPLKTEANNAVNEATNYLIEQVIPRFSTQTLLSVVTQAQRFSDTEQLISPDRNLLVDTLHANGINIRHCGLIVNHLLTLLSPNNSNNNSTTPMFRTLIVYDSIILLLVEMIARCIKVYIRSQFRSIMQQFKLPMEQPFRHAAIKILNTVFSLQANEWWQHQIIPFLETKFSPFSVQKLMDAIQVSYSVTFKNSVKPNTEVSLCARLISFIKQIHTFGIDSRVVLLHRTLNLSGLKLHDHVMNVVSSPAFWNQITPSLFDDHDLAMLGHLVKSMPITSHARGYLLKTKGINSRSVWHLEMAISEFQKSLAVNPNNKLSLRNFAQCLFVLEGLEQIRNITGTIKELSLYSRRMEKVNTLFQRAIAADVTDEETVFQFGIFMARVNRNIEATVAYLRCLQIDPNHAPCILNLVRVLTRMNRKGYADKLEHRYQILTSS